MNNPFVVREAERLAKRVIAETDCAENAVERAYTCALGREPTKKELQAAVTESRDRGLWHVCWALFNSTEFLYVR